MGMAGVRLVSGTLAAAAVAIVAIGGAAPSPSSGAPRHADLRPFGSCAQLRTYVRRHAPPPVPVAPVASGEAASADSAVKEAPSSSTNVQEAGVDEPDLVKVSGSTMFAIAGDRLRAVDLSSGLPAVLDSIALPDGPGEYAEAQERQLLISGDRALVITRSYAYQPRTLLTELDISNPAAITELSTLVVDGDYVSARLTGATARVVLDSGSSSVVPVFEEAMPSPPGAGRARGPIPRTVFHDRVAHTTTRGKLLGCRSVMRPHRFSGAEMVSVLTIDVERGLPAVDVDAVMSGGETVYASPTSLYVATEDWVDPDAPPDRVSDVDTEIHRFDTSDPDSTAYVASGRVAGFMLSQWSMSELDGVLRVASTTSPPWEEGAHTRDTESFVTALATDGGRLGQIGRLGGLGRGEQIYAVRFIDQVGYVVSFRQVDPLHVIDLSDPTNPRLEGELEIPGYSAYLHPVGDHLLLGVGQGVTPGGRPTGVQASLFDVGNPAAPVRVGMVELGSATSTEVEHDHHAFTFSPEDGLAVIPVEAWRGSDQVNGAIGVRVGPGGALSRTARTDDGSGAAAAIRRSVIIRGLVYTVSERGVGVHDPVTLDRLAFTPFTGEVTR
jgi:uncharacterized secreted protein with C-terminal beta-propeller domain